MEMPEGLDSDGAARERVLREVGETMLMIEAAIARAQRGMDTIRRDADPPAQALASLAKATRDLEGIRRRLHQEAYLHLDVLPFE
jgi:hypothetical protein